LFRRLAGLDKLPRQRTRCARFLVFQLDHSEFPDEVLYFVTGFPRLSVTAIDPQGLRTELSRLLVN
jgi:hypothetical protein